MMPSYRVPLLAIFIVTGATLSGCQKLNEAEAVDASLENSTAPISDQEISAFAEKTYDKAAMMDKTKILGIIGGQKVVVDYRCGDVCPDYTSRHIYFDVHSVSDCDQIGGSERMEGYSEGAANTMSAFCVPKILTREDVAKRQVW